MNIPTIKELYFKILSRLESEFNTNISSSARSYLRVRAAVLAAEMYLYYLFAAKVQKNLFPDTADPESQGGTLERFGRVMLDRDPLPGQAGEYLVNVTGTAAAVIPASTTFQSLDTSTSPGFLFILDSEYILTGSGDQITLRSLQVGTDSRLVATDQLEATQPLNLVDDIVTVANITIAPTEPETTAEYRERVLEAFRLEAQGGAQGDFVLWGKEVSGVNEIYPFTADAAANTVSVFVEANIVDSTDGKGSAPAAMVTAVEDAIEDPTASRPSRKPISMIVNYSSVTPLDVVVTITGFVDLTPEKTTLITNALADYLTGVRPFLAGVQVPSEQNDTINASTISAVILSAVPGSIFNAPTFTVDSNPETSYTFLNGEIPYFDTVNIS